MSDDESFGSAQEDLNDKNYDSSDDSEPLAKKKKDSPKKTKKGKPQKKSTKKDAKPYKKSKDTKTKKHNVSFAELTDPLANSDDDGSDKEGEYEVEAIVGHRDYNGKLMYKIRWKGYDAMQDTWEEYNALSCPDLLEMYNIKNKINVLSIHKKSKKGKRGVEKKSPKKAKAKSKAQKKSPKKKRRMSLSSDEEDDKSEGDFEGDDENEEYEVQNIVDMRTKKDGTREFLVHWKRWSSDYDTWEPEDNLNCPDEINKYLQKAEKLENVTIRELREERKHTDRLTLSTRDSGRRLSKRNTSKQRVKYYDAEIDD